jgi:hypothetical protein
MAGPFVPGGALSTLTGRIELNAITVPNNQTAPDGVIEINPGAWLPSPV